MTDTLTDTRPLAEIAGKLAGMLLIERRMLADLAEHQESIQEARKDLHEAMRVHGTKTVKHPRVKVIRRQGNRTTVTDRTQLEAALREAGVYESCLNQPTLDMARAKKIALDREMPGVERIPYDELAVNLEDELT